MLGIVTLCLRRQTIAENRPAPVVVISDTATVVDMPDNEEERVPRYRSIQLLPTCVT